MKVYSVYIVTLRENGQPYVGWTSQPVEKRWLQHKQAALRKSSDYFYRALTKYGFDAFDWEIVQHFDTANEAKQAEIFWIAELNTNTCRDGFGYNETDGGEGITGYFRQESDIIKLCKAQQTRAKFADHPLKRKTVIEANRIRTIAYNKELGDAHPFRRIEIRTAHSERMRGDANPMKLESNRVMQSQRMKKLRSRIDTSFKGESNGRAKLSWHDVIEIRASTLLQRELAITYNVSQVTISLIKREKIWKTKMSKMLVTGGSGFIGSHLADRLLSDGHEVHLVDNLSNGRLEFTPKGCTVLYSDFADSTVLRYIAQSKFDVVFHLAAKPRVSYSIDYPAQTNDENVGKTVHLLEACRGNVGRFVFASSSSVYGNAQQLPTPENTIRDPQSPYALQKMIGEDYCASFADLYDMDTACVRPFNVFGPRQLANGVYGTVVSSWLHAIKHGGELRSDGDGSQTRDMTHVDNVVDIFVRVAAHQGRLRGEAFNAGTGESISNKQILKHFASKHPEIQSRVKHADWRVGDVRATQADITACQRVLGYKPLTDFWPGLEATRLWALESSLF